MHAVCTYRLDLSMPLRYCDASCPCLQKGEVLPSEPRFDSNCITPGTDFMARLHEHLKYFVNKKLSSDPTWQKVEIILSGHNVGQVREMGEKGGRKRERKEREREGGREREGEGEKDLMLSRFICGGHEKTFQSMFICGAGGGG